MNVLIQAGWAAVGRLRPVVPNAGDLWRTGAPMQRSVGSAVTASRTTVTTRCIGRAFGLIVLARLAVAVPFALGLGFELFFLLLLFGEFALALFVSVVGSCQVSLSVEGWNSVRH